MAHAQFSAENLIAINPEIFSTFKRAKDVEDARVAVTELAYSLETEAMEKFRLRDDAGSLARIRDCAKILVNLLKRQSDQLAGFSVAKALFDISRGISRPDLTPAFFAEMYHIFLGLQGKGPRKALDAIHITPIRSHGRQAALERSAQLDSLYAEVDHRIAQHATGLNDAAVARREERRAHILSAMNASLEEWYDWRWQVKNVVRNVEHLEKLVTLSPEQRQAVTLAKHNKLPFGITPYYISLMDQEPGLRDAAIRAQVLPPMEYVQAMSKVQDTSSLDFMGEEDTSPFDLVTRRYPAICILKPFNTCPQICVYCQRNWEIDDAMVAGAFAGLEQIDAAINWIAEHPAIHEVLITGGDPLAMGDRAIESILKKVAAIPSVQRIRVGTRTIATMPMRVSKQLARILRRYREPGRREIAVVTHVQHPYEITPDVLKAVDLFRTRGIPVYNQLVYTFFISKRFEAAALRRNLRLIGIDPYYTFNTKGKEETVAYRVPISRLVQEQQEEARLQPGLDRTDEAVYNVPRQGKNYLKAREYRNLVSIMPNGARLYEFFPWEKKIAQSTQTHLSEDVPILDYLERLAKAGEDPSDYSTLWYYF